MPIIGTYVSAKAPKQGWRRYLWLWWLLGCWVVAGIVVVASRGRSGGPQPTLAIPLTLERAGNGVEPRVPVRLNGRGPYSFLVDTGASRSMLDSGVAREAGLTDTHEVVTIRSWVATLTRIPVVASGEWTAGEHRMPRSRFAVYDLGWSDAASRTPFSPPIAGILGSDVLRQFGVVRLDFASGQLLLRAPLPANSEPAIVTLNAEGMPVFVWLTLRGGERGLFLFDSGAGLSVIDPEAAARLGLATTGRRLTVGTLGGARSGDVVAVDGFAIGGIQLPPLRAVTLQAMNTLVETDERGGTRPIGALGADVMSTFSRVTLDYAGQRIAFESQ